MVNDLTGLGQVGSSLIDAIRSATGVAFEPRRIQRKLIAEAKGEVEAGKILALGNIENKEIVERAANRMFQKAVRQQENIESVIEEAIPMLKDQSQSDKIQEDWLNSFVDHAEKVSDIEAQKLWAKVLASEANTPGKYAVRTLDILSNMDSSDAHLFQCLATLSLNVHNESFFVFVPDAEDPIVAEAGVNFEALSHLDVIGLISFDSISGFTLLSNPQNTFCFYRNRGSVGMAVPKTPVSPGTKFTFHVGKVILTRSGTEIMTLMEGVSRKKIVEYLKAKNNQFNWKLEVTTIVSSE
jgi:Protein of unknown function (DUF2806)